MTREKECDHEFDIADWRFVVCRKCGKVMERSLEDQVKALTKKVLALTKKVRDLKDRLYWEIRELQDYNKDQNDMIIKKVIERMIKTVDGN